MESEIETPTSRPSFLLLNEYCLLEIFEFLDIDHSINLAKTCNWLRFVANRTFKKYSKFELDSSMINKGEEYIDCLFEHIGQHVASLDFDFEYHFANPTPNPFKILGKISNNCKNLKKLELSYYSKVLHDLDVQPAYRFDNVEQLTLYDCGNRFTEDFTTHFFETFDKLKSLNIVFSSIESNELRKLFQNNRGIDSFVLYEAGFNCQLLELIPNVQKLCLSCDDSFDGRIWKLDSLLKLNRLTKLRLNREFQNINNFLRELATKGIIEEMHLKVRIDDDFFDSMTSFSKLQLLVLRSRAGNVKLKSSIAWPAQLKKLRLISLKLTQPDLLSMIQQLESTNFNDATKLFQDIRNIIEQTNRRQRLDIVFPDFVKQAGPSEKYLMESEHLRILHESPNKARIEIHFDGCDFL